ncbi:hypothetical protein SDRG_03318 [Saprolegnia diclina VS20]|uniref:Pentacotripeptide-repeat region of PRORP domain-containing protein n=1 Tax=Saprolegnia diclina (strain VS20) TaxID=1156394 RepID=T0QYG9_SAPDV|nr:hypothetical protein SDRG_03318 [Saprolegnia diclina VS20]EQC39110.1 hypothetical protein SDRG_03318 [Saprolegnia diclina VS20]|eukprot:XP_008607171.1 hypothetical protein SDRG_03318 [Saprolegnia diclina VS20]
MLSRAVLRLNASPLAFTVARSFSGAAPKAAARPTRPKHSGPPTLQSTVAEIKYLSQVYSIAAASAHLPKKKLEFVVREIKGEKDLPLVREALELYESRFLHIPTYCSGTFVSKCIKTGQADLALEWMQGSKKLSKHIENGSAANLIAAFAEKGEFEKGLQVYTVLKAHGIEMTTKVFTSLIQLSKAQGNMDQAWAFALEGCSGKMLNAHGLITLLKDLPADDVAAKAAHVKQLMTLGDVHSNATLDKLLAPAAAVEEEAVAAE